MAKRNKKHAILGGVSVSSKQLSKWGSCGGRPRKWKNEAERKRFEREKKKGSALREYRSYYDEETIKINCFGKCSNCGLIDDQYQYGWDHYRWTANSDKWVCCCCHINTMEKKEEKIITRPKRAGTSTERSQRFRSKSTKSPINPAFAI